MKKTIKKTRNITGKCTTIVLLLSVLMVFFIVIETTEARADTIISSIGRLVSHDIDENSDPDVLDGCWLVYSTDQNNIKRAESIFIYSEGSQRYVEKNMDYTKEKVVNGNEYTLWRPIVNDGYSLDDEYDDSDGKVMFLRENTANGTEEEWEVCRYNDVNGCTIIDTKNNAGRHLYFAAITRGAFLQFEKYSISDWKQFDFDCLVGNGDENTVIEHTMRVYQHFDVSEITGDDDGFVQSEYETDNSNIATVDEFGIVTAKQTGTVNITARLYNETWIFKLTVEKNLAEPVPMKKLQCYKSYSKKMNSSEFKKTYDKAWKLARAYGDCSRIEQIYGVCSDIRTLALNGKYSMKKKHYSDPYGFFVKGIYSCAGITRSTILCLNMFGIKCKHINENKYEHQWATCKVSGKTWILDNGYGYVGPKSKAPKMYR